MLIVLRYLKDALHPYNGLGVYGFRPQKHILGDSFTFGQYTLNCPDTLPEDQEQDVSAHCPRLVDPCSEDDLSADIVPANLGDTLRLPLYGCGQQRSPDRLKPSV